jgi:nucleoside-diphosphate-sugar epimerase
MKRVLLVGNRSVVGQAVCKSFEKKGWVVTKAGRSGADVFLDLAQEYKIPPQIGIHDTVVFVAADFGGEDAGDLDRAERVNALGVLHACRWATEIGARHVVVVSSMSATYNSGDPYFGAYALTKRHGEELAHLYCNTVSLPLTILRPTQIYNDDESCRKHQGFFYTLIDHAAEGKDIEIFGTHDAKRNYIHLADVSEIILRVVSFHLEGIFDCPSPSDTAVSQLAKIAQSVYGRGGQIRFLSNRPDLPDLPERSGESLFQALDFRPCISLEDGIRRIKEYREGLLS